MTHEIIADLKHRYTTKKYDSTKAISPQALAVFLEALRLSASSINSQPWKFIVLESDESKQRFFNSFEDHFLFNQVHAKTASHIILFANKIIYTEQDYEAVIEKSIADQHLSAEKKSDAFAAFNFVKMNENENGEHKEWTRAQIYIALGNALHTLARQNIDSTTMEGIDSELIKQQFNQELDGYECRVALAIGYHHEDDRNARTPKSRLAFEDIIKII